MSDACCEKPHTKNPRREMFKYKQSIVVAWSLEPALIQSSRIAKLQISL
jgi:hypothetical protein